MFNPPKKITVLGTAPPTPQSTFWKHAAGSMKSAQILNRVKADITSKSSVTPSDASDGTNSTKPSASPNPSDTGILAKASTTHKSAGATAEKKRRIQPHDTVVLPKDGANDPRRVPEEIETSQSTQQSSSANQGSDDEIYSSPRTLTRQGAHFFTQVDSSLSEELHSSQEIPLTNGSFDMECAYGEKEDSESHGVFEQSAQRLGSIFGSLQPLPEDCGLMATTVTIVRSSTVCAICLKE